MKDVRILLERLEAVKVTDQLSGVVVVKGFDQAADSADQRAGLPGLRVFWPGGSYSRIARHVGPQSVGCPDVIAVSEGRGYEGHPTSGGV